MKTLGKIVGGLLVLILVAAVAGWFVLKREDIPYAELDAKYGGATSRFIGVPGGVRGHYRDQGNAAGPVLVMVHGFSSSVHTWEPWVERLGSDYRIISVDLPGHGLTRAPAGYVPTMEGYADYLDQVLGQLGVTKFTLIGSSMGGHTAWTYALKHPEKLDGLVLVGSGGWPDDPAAAKDEPMIFKVLSNPVGRAVLGKLDSTAMTREALRDAFEPTPDMADEAMVTRYVELSRAPGHREIITSLVTSGRNHATPEKMAAIKVPTLILHGDTDKLVPAGDGRKFADAISGSTLIVYEKTGHLPQEQVADRSALDLKAWLETLPLLAG